MLCQRLVASDYQRIAAGCDVPELSVIGQLATGDVCSAVRRAMHPGMARRHCAEKRKTETPKGFRLLIIV